MRLEEIQKQIAALSPARARDVLLLELARLEAETPAALLIAPAEAQGGPPEAAPSPRRCGARCRSGRPCQASPLRGHSRCAKHGGRSTGPRTEAGRAAIAESNRRRAAKS